MYVDISLTSILFILLILISILVRGSWNLYIAIKCQVQKTFLVVAMEALLENQIEILTNITPFLAPIGEVPEAYQNHCFTQMTSVGQVSKRCWRWYRHWFYGCPLFVRSHQDLPVLVSKIKAPTPKKKARTNELV